MSFKMSFKSVSVRHLLKVQRQGTCSMRPELRTRKLDGRIAWSLSLGFSWCILLSDRSLERALTAAVGYNVCEIGDRSLVKVKVAEHLYSVSSEMLHFWTAQVWITQLLHCKAHHTWLYRVVYQRAPREDERLSWPCWLTYSGRFTHQMRSVRAWRVWMRCIRLCRQSL